MARRPDGVQLGTISNCYSTGAVSGFNTVGGLAGDNDGSISDCNSTSAVNGFDTVGGLVGDNESDSSISNCDPTWCGQGFCLLSAVWWETTTAVSTIAIRQVRSMVLNTVGGLVGDNESDGSISNCYSTGAVSGSCDTSSVGGLVGYNDRGSISNCYIGGYGQRLPSDVDGIVGYNDGTVSSSYLLIPAGRIMVTDAADNAQMKQQDNFVDWDFDGVWHICETTNYPKLIWQIAPGDFVCPDGVNFADFAYLASRWHTTGCNSSNNFCGGADMDFSGKVDMRTSKFSRPTG